MKAWQREVREQRQREDSDADLFGRWWESIDIDIGKATVREIDYSIAEGVISKYEWVGTMPANVRHCFGIYFQEVCGGVVVYGNEYAENLGVWDRYNYTGKMILLARGACVHWAHQHAGSKLIRRSMDLLPSKYEVVTATTDPAAGEIGTIYQACGFYYVGSMRASNPNVNARFLDREGWLINGRVMRSRNVRSLCGSTKAADIARRFPNAEKVPQHSKHRYFAFRGTKKVQKQHKKAIEHLLKAYPKRDASKTDESA